MNLCNEHGSFDKVIHLAHKCPLCVALAEVDSLTSRLFNAEEDADRADDYRNDAEEWRTEAEELREQLEALKEKP